jgi:tRNA(Ile)-lysidine synthetase-like protein
VNHGLRGQESEAEEAFVRRFAEDHDLPLCATRLDDLLSQSGSLEANAREARYEFLRRVAEQAGAPAVATAHHADDVAESVLQRIIRGAGVQGLAALWPARRLAPGCPVQLVRPLLNVRKDELLQLLRRQGQDWCTDRTNRARDYQRNRVRHDLLPMLAEEYPQFSAASLCALNTSAREVAELVEGELDRAWPGLACFSGQGIVLEADALAALPAALRKAALRRALARLAAPEAPPGLRAEHLEGLDELARTREIGRELTLPRGFLARCEHGVVYLARAADDDVPPREQPLPTGGRLDLPWAGRSPRGLELCTAVVAGGTVGPQEAKRRSSPLEVFLALDALAPPLAVRNRRPGDLFHPLGAPGRRKLKDFLVDERVPQHLRDRLPLVVAADGRIAWVGGCRAADFARLTGREERVLHIHASPRECE